VREIKQMITSLKIMKPVEVAVGSAGKFKVNGGEALDIKDIPAVRYCFDKYGIDEVEFIKKMMGIFKHSVHVVEFSVHQPETYEAVHNEIQNVAFIAHFDITDELAKSQVYSVDDQSVLAALRTVPVNRLMLNDKSNSLDYIGMSALIKAASVVTGINARNIGICGSPYTDSSNCCMNAAIAREWSAKYNHVGEGALPSANHDNKDCGNCGCLRYEVVESDIIAVYSEAKKGFMNAPSGKAKAEKSSDSAEPKEEKPKKAKGVLSLW
jgi:hypothetical protein